jgi:hypothetical protein
MAVRVENGEDYLVQRLEREKRSGRIEKVNDYTYKFVADVYDATEMLPWIRTFIGRIVSLDCSNHHLTETFYSDLAAMEQMYGGDQNAVQ